MSIIAEKRQLVTPGELLAEGDFMSGENTFLEDGKIYAARIGLFNTDGRVVSVVGLKGAYMPQAEDEIIGKVSNIGLYGWLIDIGAPYPGIIHSSDIFERSFNPRRDELSEVFGVGDYVLAQVVSFDRTRDPVLTTRGRGFGKISHGTIIEIVPAKIPRLIGKKGSMVTMLKKETGCQILIGQNGRILVSGKHREDEELVILAIRKIEAEAHTRGLTNRVKTLIEKEKKKKGDIDG
ncbi:S1 RNA-binding domain-containing protein [Candidatus Bathyarchaeota archaeon]|nr:S1 RNA-binding domain-containing protein [Candidatus Bathyarchaeota archaeon]